jgi:eukaryotic-like serine/threonine-protein kinase
VPPKLLEPGDLVGGRYVVVELIATGGVGAVYEVEDPGGARFALKALLPEVAEDTIAHKRFRREVNAVKLLDHPNLVRAIEDLFDDGVLYLVLELVRGPTMWDELEDGPIPPRRTLAIARQILAAVGHAHSHGIVHRDLKPDNVILTPGADGPRVKLIDFGAAKLMETAAMAFGDVRLTKRGTTFGTPRYIAPEQARGGAVDGRADLYSLGVMLFEALTGDPPFPGEDDRELMRAHVKDAPPTLAERAPAAWWRTPEVEALVERALVKSPDDRYADAGAMAVAVDAAAASIDDVR